MTASNTSLFQRIRERSKTGHHHFVDLSSYSGVSETCSSSLVAAADHISKSLRVQSDKRPIVLWLDTCRAFMPAFWASLSAGRTVLPLPTASLKGKPSDSDINHLTLLFKQLDPVVIFDEDSASCRKWFPADLSSCWLSLSRLLTSLPAEESKEVHAIPDISFILQTSGTTGEPKYAAFSGEWFPYEKSNYRRVLSVFPLGSSTGINYGYLLNELSAYLPLREAMRDPDRLLHAIEIYKIEVLIIPPVLVSALLAYLTSSSTPLKRRNLSSLCKINVGSSAISLSTIEQLDELLQQWGAPSSVFHFAYGLTETGGVAYGQFSGLHFHSHQHGIKIGRISPGVDVRVTSLSPDTPGPISVRRPFTFLGYVVPNEHKAWSLIRFNSGIDWFDTGDLGFIDGDDLVITGRAKDIIVINSRKTSLTSIERYLLERMPGIFEEVIACAGPAEQLLVFLSLSDPSQSLSLEKLRVAISSELSRQFSISLSDLVMCSREELPRTETGKVRKVKLVESWSRQMQPQCDAATRMDVTSLTALLMSQIRLSSSFFLPDDPNQKLSAFGVDSLRLAQIIGNVERETGMVCRLESCPDDPKISDLVSLFAHVSSAEVHHSPRCVDARKSTSFRHPQRYALEKQIQLVNLQAGGAPVGSDRLARLYNSEKHGVPLVLVGNLPSNSIHGLARLLDNHPIYYLRALERYRDNLDRSYVACCYLDWLESALPICNPVLIGFCLAGEIVLDLARYLWHREHLPRLTVLMDFNPNQMDLADPYKGLCAYHIHEFYHRRDPSQQKAIESKIYSVTPNVAMFYWAAARTQDPSRYTDQAANGFILKKILSHPTIQQVLE